MDHLPVEIIAVGTCSICAVSCSCCSLIHPNVYQALVAEHLWLIGTVCCFCNIAVLYITSLLALDDWHCISSTSPVLSSSLTFISLASLVDVRPPLSAAATDQLQGCPVKLWITLRCVTANHAALTITTADAACLAVTQCSSIHKPAQDIRPAFTDMSMLDSFEETSCAMHVSSPECETLHSVTVIASSNCLPVGVQLLTERTVHGSTNMRCLSRLFVSTALWVTKHQSLHSCLFHFPFECHKQACSGFQGTKVKC